MSGFVWNGRERGTIGSLLDAMTLIRDIEDLEERQREATRFVNEYAAVVGEEIAESNIGFLCGEYDPSTMVRMLRLFKVQHPIFGGGDQPPPTPEEAVAAGGRWAKRNIEGFFEMPDTFEEMTEAYYKRLEGESET